MTKEEAVAHIYDTVDGDVTNIVDTINSIEVEELDNEEMLGQLKSTFDNGLGEKGITDLFRLVCLDDPNLAQTILDELRYWSNHGNNQGNV